MMNYYPLVLLTQKMDLQLHLQLIGHMKEKSFSQNY